MIARPARRCCTGKSEHRQIQFVEEHIDDPNRAVASDVIVDAVRQEKLLAAIATLDETKHRSPPN